MLADSLRIEKGITSIIGSGGKTTLMLRLAGELSAKGKVIICTSTKIEKPADFPVIDEDITLDAVEKILRTTNVVCVGSRFYPQSGAVYYKLSAPPIDFSALAELADYVLVEADGSRHMPIKAHADYEPVIPKRTKRLIGVIGLSGVGMRAGDCVHRMIEFTDILYKQTGVKAEADSVVSASMAAEVINYEYQGFLGFCKEPPIIVINQADTEEDMKLAGKLASELRYESFAGSLREGKLTKMV